jgi:hypothetical protein
MNLFLKFAGIAIFLAMSVAYGMILPSSSAKLKVTKVRRSRAVLTIERLESEGQVNKKNFDGLLKRLEGVKAVLDERIVEISGQSIRRVQFAFVDLLTHSDQLSLNLLVQRVCLTYSFSHQDNLISWSLWTVMAE